MRANVFICLHLLSNASKLQSKKKAPAIALRQGFIRFPAAHSSELAAGLITCFIESVVSDPFGHKMADIIITVVIS